MKITVDIDLEWLAEDYTLNEAFKDELKGQISQKVAGVLAKQTFMEVSKDEEIQKVKKLYDEQLKNLQQGDADLLNKVKAMVTERMDDFLAGTAYSINKWGEKTRETTVGEFIREGMEAHLKDSQKSLTELIQKQVSKAISMSDYDIKKLIEHESEKARNENAKKVAEFIIKGAF